MKHLGDILERMSGMTLRFLKNGRRKRRDYNVSFN